MSEELWLTITGFEGRYEISNYGRVRSVERYVPMAKRDGTIGRKLVRQNLLQLHTWGAKYPGLVLVDAEGNRHRRMVHRLVAEAFVPNPNCLPQVNHIDADTKNAMASNLEWCNQSHNIAHAYRIGNRGVGSAHHFARLRRDSGGRCCAAEREEF